MKMQKCKKAPERRNKAEKSPGPNSVPFTTHHQPTPIKRQNLNNTNQTPPASLAMVSKKPEQ